MSVERPRESRHERFFQLAGLIRHEYWLHGQRPEDYRFEADPDRLTISAKRQKDYGTRCVLEVTDAILADELHAVAREFYKGLFMGRSQMMRFVP